MLKKDFSYYKDWCPINKFRISQHLLLIIIAFEVDKKRIEVDYSVPVVLVKELFFNFISNRNVDFVLIISLMGTLFSLLLYLKGSETYLHGFNVMWMEYQKDNSNLIIICLVSIETNIQLNALRDKSKQNTRDRTLLKNYVDQFF
jgi:hypothetical protein